jgi:hypothetical protein
MKEACFNIGMILHGQARRGWVVSKLCGALPLLAVVHHSGLRRMRGCPVRLHRGLDCEQLLRYVGQREVTAVAYHVSCPPPRERRRMVVRASAYAHASGHSVHVFVSLITRRALASGSARH